MYKFNVIWSIKDQPKTERVVLPQVDREEGLSFVEHYYSAFIQKAVNYWESNIDNQTYTVKLERS